jgi:hypothetical protein
MLRTSACQCGHVFGCEAIAPSHESPHHLQHPRAVGVGVKAGVQQRHHLHLHVFKACLLQGLHQTARQLRPRDVLVPGVQHLPHAGVVTAGPHRRFPIGVHQQGPATWAQHPRQFLQSLGDVRHVFVHLRGQRHVKAGIGLGQLRHIQMGQLHVGQGLATLAGQPQHGLCNIHRQHAARRAHRLPQRLAGEAGAAADVQNSLANLRRDALQHLLTLRHHVGREVDRFDATRTDIVKLGQGAGGLVHAGDGKAGIRRG